MSLSACAVFWEWWRGAEGVWNLVTTRGLGHRGASCHSRAYDHPSESSRSTDRSRILDRDDNSRHVAGAKGVRFAREQLTI